MAHEQNTQNVTLVGEVPGTTPVLNMAQAEKLASSRAALVKRLDEAREVYKESVGNATAFEARNMLAAYIEGTEGLLDYKPQLAENFEACTGAEDSDGRCARRYGGQAYQGQGVRRDAGQDD